MKFIVKEIKGNEGEKVNKLLTEKNPRERGEERKIEERREKGEREEKERRKRGEREEKEDKDKEEKLTCQLIKIPVKRRDLNRQALPLPHT